MVRFVIDLAKAEQLGLFGNKQPSKGPMFPRPSAPAAGGGGTKWVQVPGFARKDGTQVKAHLRHVTQAKPGDAHYKPATGDTHESLHFHATFAAEAAKRDGDKGAEEQLRGIAQQAARGGLDRKWAKETLSTLKRSHHIIGKLEEKEAAVGPAPKAKKPTKPKEPAQPSEPKTPPVDPTMWKVTTKFGPAGGPRVHALTDAGYDAAYRRATRLAPKTREALERMRSKPMPIETIDGSTIRAVNKPHYESARQLVTAGFAEFVPSDGQNGRSYKITDAGRQALNDFHAEADRLLQRVDRAHPIEADTASEYRGSPFPVDAEPTAPAEPTPSPTFAEASRNLNRKGHKDAEAVHDKAAQAARAVGDSDGWHRAQYHAAMSEAHGYAATGDHARAESSFKNAQHWHATKPTTPVHVPPPPAADYDTTDHAYEQAMKTAKPGNWQPLVERYSGNAATQKELGAWLDQYASTADDAAALLDARDSAAEAGIRSDDYHGIAKRLGVKRKK